MARSDSVVPAVRHSHYAVPYNRLKNFPSHPSQPFAPQKARLLIYINIYIYIYIYIYLTCRSGTSASISSARLSLQDLLKRILCSRFCNGGLDAIILPVVVNMSTLGFTRTPPDDVTRDHDKSGNIPFNRGTRQSSSPGLGFVKHTCSRGVQQSHIR